MNRYGLLFGTENTLAVGERGKGSGDGCWLVIRWKERYRWWRRRIRRCKPRRVIPRLDFEIIISIFRMFHSASWWWLVSGISGKNLSSIVLLAIENILPLLVDDGRRWVALEGRVGGWLVWLLLLLVLGLPFPCPKSKSSSQFTESYKHALSRGLYTPPAFPAGVRPDSDGLNLSRMPIFWLWNGWNCPVTFQ